MYINAVYFSYFDPLSDPDLWPVFGMNDMKSILCCHDYVGEVPSINSYMSPHLTLPINGLNPDPPG